MGLVGVKVARDGVGRDGEGWDGEGWDGVGRDGEGRDGEGWDRGSPTRFQTIEKSACTSPRPWALADPRVNHP